MNWNTIIARQTEFELQENTVEPKILNISSDYWKYSAGQVVPVEREEEVNMSGQWQNFIPVYLFMGVVLDLLGSSIIFSVLLLATKLNV